MSKHINLICYRWGTKYGVEYVNRLYGMVSRNLTIPFTLHCMTDDLNGLRKEVAGHLLPPDHLNGNLNKIMTFQKNFLDLEGELLVSLDLDLVIVGNIDFLADNPEDDFKICGGSWVPGGVRGNGSVYRVRVGALSYVWENMMSNPEGLIDFNQNRKNLLGEQKYLNRVIENYTYFPDHKIVSFKRHCHAKGYSLFGDWGESHGLTTAIFGKASPPTEAAIVSFHGRPLPLDVMNSRCGKWRRAPFVKEHWRE